MKKIDIIDNAKRILETEANSILEFRRRISHEFIKAVETITKCEGKIFVTGVGKSGLIANKISSTLSSLGSPSIAINPLDALHGDLGMIERKDILLIISNSGESKEILSILQYILKKENLIISITNNKTSKIAKAAHININSHCTNEANEIGLVPTCSTTTTLAIGDALALTVSKLKGHKIKDYAEIHPSGSIGKCLYMNVEELMIKTKLPLCPEETEINKVLNIMEESSLGSAFITSKKKLKGIITDGDLRRFFKTNKIRNTKAKDIMTKNPKYIFKTSKAYEAFDKMIVNKISILPVIDSEGVVGAIQLYNINY